MKQFSYKVDHDFDLKNFTDVLGLKLAGYGYQVNLNPFSNEATTSLNITKDQSDFNKFAGLSTECNVTLNKMNEYLTVNYEDVWTNKILACAIGWFLCGIGLLTGLYGAYKQSNMSGEIQTTIMSTVAEMMVDHQVRNNL